MDLTKKELDFIREKGFTKLHVFNAVGMRKADWKLLMKKEDKPIALGNPCNNGQHRLKWPYGLCAQCNPNHIGKSFSSRFSETKYIYVAGSLSQRIVKIGVGDDPHKRVYKLNYDCYAGAADWQLLFQVKVPNAGRVEHDALLSLKKHSARRFYLKDGYKQEAIEALECSYSLALQAIFTAIKVRKSEPWQTHDHKKYDFK